jgi:hypothetical protein
MRQTQAVVEEARTEAERLSPSSLRRAKRRSPSYAAYSYKSMRVGTASVVLMNRSIVSPACNRLPQVDQLSSDCACSSVMPTMVSSGMNDDPPSRVEFHAHLL